MVGSYCLAHALVREGLTSNSLGLVVLSSMKRVGNPGISRHQEIDVLSHLIKRPTYRRRTINTFPIIDVWPWPFSKSPSSISELAGQFNNPSPCHHITIILPNVSFADLSRLLLLRKLRPVMLSVASTIACNHTQPNN